MKNQSESIFLQKRFLHTLYAEQQLIFLEGRYHEFSIQAVFQKNKHFGIVPSLHCPRFIPYNIIADHQIFKHKLHTQYKILNHCFDDLVNKLPFFHTISFKPHHQIPLLSKWLQHGFKAYSFPNYILGHNTIEHHYNNLPSEVRNHISNADRSCTYLIDDVEDLWSIVHSNAEKVKDFAYISFDTLQKLSTIFSDTDYIKIISAKDEHQNSLAAAMFVRDHEQIVYLLGGVNPHFKQSGSLTAIIWKGIQWAMDLQLEFNFDGSSIPEVERFFQQFNPESRPLTLCKKSIL